MVNVVAKFVPRKVNELYAAVVRGLRESAQVHHQLLEALNTWDVPTAASSSSVSAAADD
jgi:hypothetical protein